VERAGFKADLAISCSNRSIALKHADFNAALAGRGRVEGKVQVKAIGGRAKILTESGVILVEEAGLGGREARSDRGGEELGAKAPAESAYATRAFVLVCEEAALHTKQRLMVQQNTGRRARRSICNVSSGVTHRLRQLHNCSVVLFRLRLRLPHLLSLVCWKLQ
jgi:hypothetical protein